MNESEQQAQQEAPKDEERPECLCDLITEGFKGPMRWMVAVAWIYGIAFVVVGVWSAVKFFHVESIRSMILCATLFLASLLILVVVKLWYWMWIIRGWVIREIRRLAG